MEKQIKMLRYLDAALVLYDAKIVNEKDTLRNVMSIVWNLKNRDDIQTNLCKDRLLW